MKITALLLILLVSPNLWAQGVTTTITKKNGEVVDVEKTPKPVPEVFNSFEETDDNGDGRVTAEEARDAGILEFSVADVDNDGLLDAKEYRDAADVVAPE
ncbi:MAG: hypothetical protein HC808_19840 [Candidatus Competibacteraceae bacterium]|nr:hypothetical protein [Candidatus Competibacteraceae bacterium]